MKKITLILFLIFSNGFAQTIIKGLILDNNNQPLPTANIAFVKNYGGTNSNLSGFYSIDIFTRQNDSLKISYTGFKPKYIALRSFTEKKEYQLNINLEIDETIIEEVVIDKKQTKYTQKEKINIKKKGDIRTFAMVGCEFALRVKNAKQEKGRIKEIQISFRRNPKANTLTKYRVKIYELDTITSGPGKNLIKEDILISPKNKTYLYNLNVEDKKIPFPKFGVFVGVELIDPDNSLKKGDIVGPGLKYTAGSNELLTWENYRGKKWYKSRTTKLVPNPTNIILNLTVLYKKSNEENNNLDN